MVNMYFGRGSWTVDVSQVLATVAELEQRC
jgi:hypothetical protein